MAIGGAAFVAATAWVALGRDDLGPANRPSPAAKGNLAQAAVVSVSSEQNGFAKARAIDGDRLTEWASSDKQPWIKLRWKEPVKVGRIVVRDRADSKNRAQGGKLLLSDGSVLDIDDIPLGGPARGAVRAKDGKLATVGLVQRPGRTPGPGGNRGLCGWRARCLNRSPRVIRPRGRW